jgi:hypothetical protein
MGGITVTDPLAEVLAEQGIPQVPEVGQVHGEVVLLLLRHNGQFFLNLFQRHTDFSLTGTPSKGKGSIQGLGLVIKAQMEDGLRRTGLPVASQISGASADLQRVIDCWPAVSEPLKNAVSAIVKAVADREGL